MMINGQHWRAFGSLFFLLHQDKLLWLLNASVIGRLFRRILRISGDSSSVGGRRIFRILPNAIFWWDGHRQKAEFRTHAKFSKRIYHTFAPLWWTMHGWDWAFADRWVPELSFGFSTLTAYPNADADDPKTTVDGITKHRLTSGSGVDWSVLVAAAGTAGESNWSTDHVFYSQSDSVSGKWKSLDRTMYLFDTSAISADDLLFGATLSLYGYSKADTGSYTPDVNIYSSEPASNTAIAAGDFDSYGSTPFSSAITYASWSTSAYNDFSLNADGIANITKGGVSKFGARNANRDVANSAPTWGNTLSAYVDGYFSDNTGTANDPKLVVIYGAPPYANSTYVTDITFNEGTDGSSGAPGSDNWPVCEADDGHQYAIWGDGSGFAPTENSNYVSFGVARIEGSRASFTGYNRLNGYLPEYTQAIDGKSYGIICIGGALYAWWGPGNGVTSYTETKMIKSTNYGQSWTTSTWDLVTDSATCIMPTFCTFGANYAGNIDGYVYMYFIRKQGTPTGLGVMIPGYIDLARVPVADIFDKTQFEWFTGMSGDTPTWSSTIGNRTAVFSDASNGVGWNCSVSYNPGIGRYILMTEHAVTMQGNLGIFEAPNPWGPWKTVKYYSGWRSTASMFWNISNKWSSGNGFTLFYTGNGTYDDLWMIDGSFVTSGGLDAILKKVFTKTPSLDGVLSKADLSRTLDADGLLQKLGLTKAASLDAILYAAVTYYLTTQLDSNLNATGQTKALNADGVLSKADQTKAASADGTLQKEQAKTAQTDAYLVKEAAVTASLDAALNRVGITRTASLDALLNKIANAETASLDADLLKLAVTRTLGLDAILFSPGGDTRALNLDAALNKAGLTRLSSIDSFLQAAAMTATVQLDAYLKASLANTAVLDSYLSRGTTGQAALDAYLKKTIAAAVGLDALLSGSDFMRSVSMDAIMFSETGSFVGMVIDALLSATGATRTAMIDALLSGGFSETAGFDACLERIGGATGQRQSVNLGRGDAQNVILSHTKPSINLRNTRRVQ